MNILMKNKTISLLLIMTFAISSFMSTSLPLYGTENHFNQENIVKDYTLIQKPSINVIGIACRTSNAPENGPQDIPRLWEQFYSENVINKIPNKISNEVIALYCDYEGDYTQPYSLVIGCPVSSLGSVPGGMVSKVIPAGSYAVFHAIGEYPKSLIETWGNIWQTDLDRTYTGDYELYGEKFTSESSKEVGVYIAIEESNLTKIDEMVRKNQQKFSCLKQLNLPIDQYAITGSGALGIRNLKEIDDLDIIVTPALWNALAKQYCIVDENNIKKIILHTGIVEALGEESFYTEEKTKDVPSIVDRITHAEIIDQLPFESLEHVLYYKRKMGRDKDLNDIFIIEKTISERSCFEVRAFISDVDQIKEKLSHYHAVFKGNYSFKDYIYYPNDREFDLNKEFVRLRTFQKTNWNQKPVELVYKLKTFSDRSGSTQFKKQFDCLENAIDFLNNYKLAFSYARNGFEYSLGSIRIFLEDIDSLPPSLELLSNSKEEMNKLFNLLAPVQILSDSVPRLIQKNRKE